MSKATHASITLARFDDPREIGPVSEDPRPETLFLNVGADHRAANSDFKSLQAFKFAMVGLHTSETAARKTVEDRLEIAPWMNEASELWSGVVQPFRHFGEANFLDADQPGPLYDVTLAPPTENTPIMIMTSVGWNITEDLDWDRVKRFSDAVAAVRIGMTGLPGLHSQQTFSFPGMRLLDGITLTFWKDLASAMGFAYGPGFHRTQVKHQREVGDGDRTSFTRFVALHSEGKWHGSDPFSSSD